jgi:hypothetical protein
MGEVKFCAQFLAMTLLIVIRMESRVDFVVWRHFVLVLTEDQASLDIMQENIKLVGLVGKPPFVEKHVQALPWFSRWGFDCKYGRWDGIQR